MTFYSVSLRIFWGKYGRARSPLAVGAGGRRIQAERQLVCHMEKDGPEERGAFTLAHPCREPSAPWGGWISGYTSHGSILEARALSW